MTERRLPAGFNDAAENDFIQKGANGYWVSRGAGEVVMPNVVVSVNDTSTMPSRLGGVVTIEVDTAHANWGDDTITLCPVALPGDVIRVIDVGGSTGTSANIVVLPGGSATIEGRASYNLNVPYAMVGFYRKTDGNWVVISEGQNVNTEESVSISPITLGNNGAYVVGMDHLVRVITSTSWPATGGTITLPTTSRRGARVTICEWSGNAASKEINVSPGAGQINNASATLRFNNPFGSVTLENTVSGAGQWRIVACSARYYQSISAAATVQGVAFWHVIPVTVFITGGFASLASITIPDGAHVGAQIEILNNHSPSGGGNGDNMNVTATGGSINGNGSIRMSDYLPGGSCFQSMGLKKASDGTNTWLITHRAWTIAV